MRHFGGARHVSLMMFALLFLTTLLAVVRSQPASAAGVVSQCTEAALRNALAGGGLVAFSCSGTIPLASQLEITQDTTIDGGGVVTLDGGGATRLFVVNGGASLTVRGLTLTRGFSTGFDGGSAILNFGSLTVEASTLTGNQATWGGAIDNRGSLTITTSTLSGNSTQFGGGVIYNDPGATATIAASTLTNNRAGGNGGAIFNDDATLTIDASTVADNTAVGFGGAILNFAGTTTITASTLAGNSAREGGAIYNLASVTLTASTLTDNTASHIGGAIANGGLMTLSTSTLAGNSAGNIGGAIANSGPLTISASTLSGNSASEGGTFFGGASTATLTGSILNGSNLCGGPIPLTSNGANVASDAGCNLTAAGDVQNVDPLLGSLQDNGGPTFTMLPQAGSPALDRVPNALCATLSAANEGRDQRGVDRPVGAYPCDSGSVEVGATIQDIAVSVADAQVTLMVTASDPFGGPLFYRFECAGGMIGPQPDPMAVCDFGRQTGQFAVQVEATDANGIGVSETVVVELPTALCVGERSGSPRLMSAPGGCVRGELPLVLTAVGSWSFCVGERSGSLRYLFNATTNCLRGEWKLTLPEQGPITVCVGERSGSMRYVAQASQCNVRGELVYSIANRVE